MKDIIIGGGDGGVPGVGTPQNEAPGDRLDPRDERSVLFHMQHNGGDWAAAVRVVRGVPSRSRSRTPVFKSEMGDRR